MSNCSIQQSPVGGQWSLIKHVRYSPTVGRLSLILVFSFYFFVFAMPQAASQKPGTTPVKVSHEVQVLHGRKYYVHIVETGQTVYSIAKAYKVESYDAVTHVDIHFLHAGDTVWLPVKGPLPVSAEESTSPKQENRKAEDTQREIRKTEAPKQETSRPTPSTPEVRPMGKVLRMSLVMPLYLDKMDEISTSKFDVDQRGKKSYKQFEFIEFYEGMRLALDQLADQGISVELNVADVSDNNAVSVEKAYASHHVGDADLMVALLFRDAFTKAAELAQQSGTYIVNPMSVRSEICTENPYMVKIQPSLESQIATMLDNMELERPGSHLYIVHSGATAEKPVLDELKRQLAERKKMKYTLLNWSQNNKITATLKATPGCNVMSICELRTDQMRVYVSNLLNRLSAIKSNSPTFYTLNDWTREYPDVDFAQLQLLNYHTFTSSWDMTNTVHVEFLKSFRQRYGSEPTSILAATGYDLTYYLVKGLSRRKDLFWKRPDSTLPELIHPLHLSRRQAGLENDQPQLYRMESLHFVPAISK